MLGVEILREVAGMLKKALPEKQPPWMGGQPLTSEEFAQLPPPDQLRYEVAREVFNQGLDPRKGKGKRLFESKLGEVRTSWLRQ